MSTLTLIRGLPGSGKSTLAKYITQGRANTKHFEADMYFMKTGFYEFDASKLHDAHQWCIWETDEHLFYKYDVVVSNTFTTIKELKPYFEIANKNESKIQVILCQGNFTSIHSVPTETIQKMRNRFVYDLSDLYKKD